MNRPANQLNLNTLHSFEFLLLLVTLNFCANLAARQTPFQPEGNTSSQAARRIVVSIPLRKLALLEGDRIIKIYDVTVGAPASPSPYGEFQIVQRLENPTYYKPGVVIGPGAHNPLGPRWIGLSVKGFGLHGTNQPNSIGKDASHGCIRLRNRDIKDLFARVQVGDRVSIIAERSYELARLFDAAPNFDEAHDTLQASNQSPEPPETDGIAQQIPSPPKENPHGNIH
jgi:L,D-transpeptidase catalytic domain